MTDNAPSVTPDEVNRIIGKAKPDANGNYTLDFDAMFDAAVAARQRDWGGERAKTIGASEVFSCMRKLFFDKRGNDLGFRIDTDYTEAWGATERGNLIENHHVVPALIHSLPDGVQLHYAGSAQVTLLDKKAPRNSATPDGLYTGLPKCKKLTIKAGGHYIVIDDFKTGCLGLEIKSIDPRARLEEERVKHFGQTQVGMGMIREDKKTKWMPDHWLILYFDCSFLDNMTPFLIDWEPGIYEAAKKRAPVIWEYDEPTAFAAEGKLTGECDHCKWRTACGEAVVGELKFTSVKPCSDPEVIDAISDAVLDFLAKKASVGFAEEELELAKDRVKQAMLANRVRVVDAPTWKATWSSQSGNKRVNYKQLIEDHQIDTTPYQVEGAPFDKLLVTNRGKNDPT